MKNLKMIIMAVAIVFSSNAFALRCGNALINEGATIGQARAACTIDSEYRVNNALADILKLYVKEGSMTHELVFIDGKLNTINSSRF